MLSVYAARLSADRPLDGLVIGERPAPLATEGWSIIDMKATTLNHHDLWSLRGVGLSADRLPMILGCDGAGVDADGKEVIVFPVANAPDWDGPEPLDPRRSILSERYDGTFAEQLAVPTHCLVPKPSAMNWEVAACLSLTWLTAWRMIMHQAELPDGGLLLIQGAGGGVNSAAIQLAAAAGYRVWVTSRDQQKRHRATQIGAEQAFAPGARLPQKVDAVIDNVGEASFGHSINVLKPGGVLVTCGATSGDTIPAGALTKIFFRELRIHGSTVGTRDELEELVAFVARHGLTPVIDRTLPLERAREGFDAMLAGDQFGKIVFTV